MRRMLLLAVWMSVAVLHAQPLDAILKEISPDTIRASVETLAGFHTRHTMSDTVSEVRGIGAARRWIHREMGRYAAESGGRLRVSYHRYTQPPARRISRETEIVNVVAVLPGTTDPDRILVVSGHYDSICGVNTDADCHAPGAEDGVVYGDLPEFVDPAYIARVAGVNAVALAATAWAPAPPADVRMDLSGLTNDTTIRWKANTEADLAGYRIVWRKTTSPHWEHHQDVGLETTATIPLSKDNWIFGVQARNTRGFVSPAVYPLP